MGRGQNHTPSATHGADERRFGHPAAGRRGRGSRAVMQTAAHLEGYVNEVQLKEIENVIGRRGGSGATLRYLGDCLIDVDVYVPASDSHVQFVLDDQGERVEQLPDWAQAQREGAQEAVIWPLQLQALARLLGEHDGSYMELDNHPDETRVLLVSTDGESGGHRFTVGADGTVRAGHRLTS